MVTIAETPAGIVTRGPANDRSAGAPDSTSPPLSLRTTWLILRFTFGLVPIVAGLDKFTNYLVNWENYLNPLVLRVIPISGHTFMSIAGIIEIAAGAFTLARPRPGGLIVMAWLICVALSLISGGEYLDVAIRDLVMAAGAFTLANLSSIINNSNIRRSL